MAADRLPNAMRAVVEAAAPQAEPVAGLYKRLAEAHDASLDDDHEVCRTILVECMSLLAAPQSATVQAQDTALLRQAVAALIEAARCVQTNYLPDGFGHDWDEIIAALRARLGGAA